MYQLDKLKNIPGLVHGFSDIKDGNMSFVWGEREEVLKNRKAFFDKLGVKPEDSAAMFLKHGTEIASVSETSKGEQEIPVDCLITKSKNLFLLVLTADCLPIILHDPINGVLALAHLSRINTPENFITKVIERMKSECNAQAENIFVGIGPCIQKKSYIFSGDEFEKRVPDEGVFNGFVSDLPGGPLRLNGSETSGKSIDLIGYNVEQMVSAGIKKENIEISDIDTERNMNFFSHYRSVRSGEPEGRMATVVGML